VPVHVSASKFSNRQLSRYYLYIAIEDRVLVELHRAAVLSGRPGVAVPSQDLAGADQQTGGRARTKQALLRLARAGRIIAVRKDLLVLPDATGRATVGLAELVDAVAPAPYLITGGRALQHNRLTDQYFFTTTVLVPTPVRGFSYRGETAVFATTESRRIWGWNDDERPRYASPERVLMDVLSHSRYGVSLSQALQALRLAVDRDPEVTGRLVDSARRYGSAAISRRLGLLVDRLFGSEAAAPFAELIGKSRTPVLLRPGGPRKGDIDRTWRVMVNATIELGAPSA
jgi:predicted transcriptional regulator of viral defense system